MKQAHFLGCLLALFALAACGGGGGGGTPADITTDPIAQDGSAPAETSSPTTGVAGNLVVIRYDHNGDTHPDLLTLDTAVEPFQIREALEGTPEGEARDVSEALRGHPIDPAIADALARHLAESFALGEETDLEVMVGGLPVELTVVE